MNELESTTEMDLSVDLNFHREIEEKFNINGNLLRNTTEISHSGRLVCKTSPIGVTLESSNHGVSDYNLLHANVCKFIIHLDSHFLLIKKCPWFRKSFLPVEMMIKYYANRFAAFVSARFAYFCVIYTLLFGLVIGWSVMKKDYLFLSSDPLKLLISWYGFFREALTLTISLLTLCLMIRGVVAIENMSAPRSGSSYSSQSLTEQTLKDSRDGSYELEFGHHEVIARMLFLFLIVGRSDKYSDLDAEPLGYVHLTWLMHHSPEWNRLVRDILNNVRELSSYWCDGDRTFPHVVLDLNDLTNGLAYECNAHDRDFMVFALCAVVSGLIPKDINWKRFFSTKSYIRYLHGGSSYYTDISQFIKKAEIPYYAGDLLYFYEKSLSKKFIRFGQIKGVVVVRGGFIPNGCLSLE